MASHLANIFGTEQDRVNCSFYLKIGACRHGDRCSRKHIHPQYSQTILLPNVYNNPIHTPEGQNMSAEELQANFDRFYEDFFIELAKYGHLLEMHVCDNVGDHLMGNVYARYEWEAEAAKAVSALNDRCFCNFMHLCHPTKSLVSSLHASQRVSRRKAGDDPAAGQGDMGWTPSAARSGGGGGGGGDAWTPRDRGDRGDRGRNGDDGGYRRDERRY
ncbi:hypothetical protein EHS25_009700 [Saitozyma podzolica]|uniref:C3H1-type domain-containing protein n=1 Tax=Saitozyma podzolica TaxID=1890683 RepID=A0A427YK09_9TREE|nr:hypothetical protein EHS25_009700 [Saitozyma podzolica]